MSYLSEETAAPFPLTDLVSSESPAIASGECRPTLCWTPTHQTLGTDTSCTLKPGRSTALQESGTAMICDNPVVASWLGLIPSNMWSHVVAGIVQQVIPDATV